MNVYLSITLVSIYPTEHLKEILHVDNVDEWLRDSLSRYSGDEYMSLNDVHIEWSRGGQTCYWTLLIGEYEDKLAVDLARNWMDRLVDALGHLPILFYLTLCSSQKLLEFINVDELVNAYSGPVLLIEKRIWRLSQPFQMAYAKENEFFPVERGLFIVNRDPEKVWLDRLESKLSSLSSRPSRHSLDYVPNDESTLHPEIREERQNLDTLVNILTTLQRKFKPQKVSVHLMKGEKAETISLRAYQDTPVGKKSNGSTTLGGRSLLVSCNNDANRLAGWREGDSTYEVHNAASLHLTASAAQGSLPEAMMTGRVILKAAWIEGPYKTPGEPPKVYRPRHSMVWPHSNLSDDFSSD